MGALSVAGGLVVAGLVVVGVALAALTRGHLGWARVPNRTIAALVLTAGVVVVFGGAGIAAHDRLVTVSPNATSTAAPTASASPSGTAAAAPGATAPTVWDSLAQCEAGGDWALNTNNGRYGGLQLDQSTWLSNGGQAFAPVPSDATREQQIVVAEKVRAAHGFSQWSSCAADLGLR